MPSGKQNGSPPPGLPPGVTEAQFEEFKRMAEDQTVAAMVPLILGLAPSLNPGRTEAVARAAVKQQSAPEFDQVLADATDPALREKHAFWGVTLKKPGSSRDVLRVEAPKDPAKCKTPDELLRYVTIVGLVTNPTTRALLLCYGLEPYFFQKTGSPIVTLT